MNADNFVPFDDGYLPLGEIRPVSDKPKEECSDFRSYKRLGDVIDKCPGGDNKGYVMPFVINNLEENYDNRVMRFEPVQIYHANWPKLMLLI